jgi:hypothetical protein
MELDESLRPFPRAERYLSDRADGDLPCLELTDRVSDMLGVVLQDITLPPHGGDPDDFWEQRRAVMYLGILATRSIRTQMLLQRWGYDAEAYVFQRRTIEIHGRIERVVDPANGPQRAREWLKGGDRKPSAVADIPQWFWRGLSHVAHADYRAVEQHLIRPRDDGQHDFIVLPYRSIGAGNAALLHSASLGLEIVQYIAVLVGRENVAGLEQLTADLARATQRWMPEPRDASA